MGSVLRVRFTKQATKQITEALDYVAERSADGAINVRDRLRSIMMVLAEHPEAGRKTDRQGIRRFVATPYPYLIDYRVTPSEIVILRFRHAARRST